MINTKLLFHFLAASRRIIVRRQTENVKPAVAVIDKKTVAAVADKRVAAEQVLDKKTEGAEELEERFVNSE